MTRGPKTAAVVECGPTCVGQQDLSTRFLSTNDSDPNSLTTLSQLITDQQIHHSVKPSPLGIIISIACLSGTAMATSYRYVTTKDAAYTFFLVFGIANNASSSVVMGSALLFFAMDCIITVARSCAKVAELPRFLAMLHENITFLKETNYDKTLYFELGILTVSLCSAALSSGLKGIVGVRLLGEEIIAWVTAHPSPLANDMLTVCSWFACIASGLRSIAFQGHEGLLTLRIQAVLKNNPHKEDFYRKNKCQIYRDNAITFLISVAMAMITMMAVVYGKNRDGKIEDLSWKAVLEIVFLVFFNIVLNTFFTTGPNYIYTKIQDSSKKAHFAEAEHVLSTSAWSCCFFGYLIGGVSSLGNSWAVYGPIMHLLLKFFQDEKMTNKTTNYILGSAGLAMALLFGYFMFVRDFAFYTKRLLRGVMEWDRNRDAIADETVRLHGAIC